MDCPCHVLVAQLLKSIPIVNWHETLVEENVLTTDYIWHLKGIGKIIMTMKLNC